MRNVWQRGFVGGAALLGLGLILGPALAEEGKKSVAGKNAPKVGKQTGRLPVVDRLFPAFEDLLEQMAPGMDPDALAELKKQMAQQRKLVEDILRRQPRFGQPLPPLPNMPLFPGGRFGGLGRPGRPAGSQQ